MSKGVAVALIAWFALGLFDLWSGFVEFSILRLALLLVLAVLLLPWDALPVVRRVWVYLENRHWGLVFLSILVLSGYALFLTRYLRGANMADDMTFQEVITNTASGCFFCFSRAPGGIYFGNHNNLFLVLFVPLTVLPFWWPLAHLIQSLVIVIWCRVCGWTIGSNSGWGWITTIALFLATYTEHANFYDTRFAALSLCIFAVGYYLVSQKALWTGALGALASRETAALIIFMFSVQGLFRKKARITFGVTALLSLSWFIGSYMFMSASGRPPALGAFNSCFDPTRSLIPNSHCLVDLLSTDWQLKLAYSLRLMRFAPTLSSLPSLVAASPEFGLAWLSQDNLIYSLAWHYYLQPLGILIVGAGLSWRKRMHPSSSNLPFRWIIATCLWQFVTTVRPNLF